MLVSPPIVLSNYCPTASPNYYPLGIIWRACMEVIYFVPGILTASIIDACCLITNPKVPYNCPISKSVDINTASRFLTCCVIDSASHKVSVVYKTPTYYVFFCNSSPTDYNPACTMMSNKNFWLTQPRNFSVTRIGPSDPSMKLLLRPSLCHAQLRSEWKPRNRRSAWDDKQIHSFHHNSSRLQPSW